MRKKHQIDHKLLDEKTGQSIKKRKYEPPMLDIDLLGKTKNKASVVIGEQSSYSSWNGRHWNTVWRGPLAWS
jgi:hypothetical protein